MAKRTLQEAKAERRRRWAQREARQYPREIALYGLLSIVAAVVFGFWCSISLSLFASVGLSASIIVFAAAVSASWIWDDRR